MKDEQAAFDFVKGMRDFDSVFENNYNGDYDKEALTWNGIAEEIEKKTEQLRVLTQAQGRYSDFCNRFGLRYESTLKRRIAQFEVVTELLSFCCTIPRNWWSQEHSPTVVFEKWKSCVSKSEEHARRNEYGLNYAALERLSHKYYSHIEAQAEHGFNFVSYCLNYVDDRKAKIGLKQAYTRLPKKLEGDVWHDVTLHAAEAKNVLHALIESAGAHLILKQLTAAYINAPSNSSEWLEQDRIQNIQRLTFAVEKHREKTELFNVASEGWQSFWEIQDGHSREQLKAYKEELVSTVPLVGLGDNVELALEWLNRDIEELSGFIKKYQRPGDLSRSVFASIGAAQTYQETTVFLADLQAYQVINDRSNPDWSLLETTIDWRDEFEEISRAYRLDVDSAFWPRVETATAGHLHTIDSVVTGLQNFFTLSVGKDSKYADLWDILEGVAKGLNIHQHWVQKKKWEQKMLAYPEIKDLWDKVVAGKVNVAHAEKLFVFNFLLACQPIAEPTGEDLKQAIESFSNQDGNLEQWSVERLKDALSDHLSDATQNHLAQYSEIQRLSALQKPRGTVREILNKNIDFLLAAKCCWMMSPTSLANLVDFNSAFKSKVAPFDLVIFDEASQVRVTDGMLSMAFGKQVIIVGDRNQLPPTDFFASSFFDEDEASEDLGLSESLLEELAGVFEENVTHAMLMCHYRSETPDLIRFSNEFFYKGRLEMYPPAHVSGIGRRLHYVSNGIYSKNRANESEADEVLRLIEAHVKACPDKSLGVVTMNIPQMELIDQKIQSASSQVRQFCYDEQRFFLRNLETVQGDEMDRIILSLTYGKNESGQFNASVLGPLLKSGGERRLNVAITRSRSGMTVVTSINSADLDSSAAQSRGFKCLKEFIHDLEAGSRLSNFGMSAERFKKNENGVSNVVYCESPFEEEVVSFLENSGYEVECQYGCGGFRIDIVVKERGRCLLAIECDGAGYHSSLVARTRDRARQRLLEKIGWRFYRVWSTNWWHFEEQEKVSILSAIQEARTHLK